MTRSASSVRDIAATIQAVLLFASVTVGCGSSDARDPAPGETPKDDGAPSAENGSATHPPAFDAASSSPNAGSAAPSVAPPPASAAPSSPSAAPPPAAAAPMVPGPAATPPPAAPSALPDIVFTMGAHIAQGVETTECVLVAMPTDRGEIAVPSAESSYTAGSHHFLVYRTNLTSIPEGGGEVYNCSDGDIDAHTSGTYYEAQSPESRRDLPPGVAHIFKPGEVMLLTSHYVNATTADLDAHMKFTLHTVERSTIKYEAGSIFFYNAKISLPPHSAMTVTRTCPIPSDMNLALIWPHMHKQGVRFAATTNDATAQNPLYAGEGWAEPTPRSFPYDPPMTLHAGSTITYTCEYQNDTDRMIVSGQSARTNEMCILHGMYWPRADTKTEMCSMGTSTMPMPVATPTP